MRMQYIGSFAKGLEQNNYRRELSVKRRIMILLTESFFVILYKKRNADLCNGEKDGKLY